MTRGATALGALVVAVALVSAAGTACRSSAEAPAGPADKAAPYTIQVSPAKVSVGATVEVTIRFTPDKTHHWNEEYPAKLTFPMGTKAAAAKETYTKADFVVREGAAALTVKVTGKQAGEEILTAKAKFSVCNDTTCLIEKKDVAVKVEVTP